MNYYRNSRYSDALINEVVNQVKCHNRLLSEVAKDYGIASKTVYNWVKSTDNTKLNKKHQIVGQIASLQQQIKSLHQQLQSIA
ncbi:transposase [Shewanella aestuarii]|uniref:Transposase n=1 Tax=Shewanella aestuarii TaxID=1028752 RepID=A0A6G9QHY3_9GAMM|nr:transposase [Shewanella aestuarii]QIR13501.1 transposase [Shewanella aestuarii]